MAIKKHKTQFDIAATDGASAVFAAVSRNMGGVEKAAARMGQTLRTVLAATSALTFGRAIADATLQAEQASNRLTAVLKATGGAAGFTKDQLDGMADALAESTQFDDEGIRNAEAALLKFGNIQGDVFRNGLRLSTDLAAFMGSDVPQAAEMIGKSLQSPTEGITMMEREFGKLTDAERRHIETLIRQGDAIGAQNAVLELWQKKIGGTAQLMNTGLTGALAGVGKQWGELLEDLGKKGAPLNSLLIGVQDDLRGLRQQLQPDEAIDKFRKQLFEVSEQIDALAAAEKRRRAAGDNRVVPVQGPNGLVVGDPAGELARLKEKRRGIEAEIRAQQNAGNPDTLDARDLMAHPAVKPAAITLGGRTPAEEAAAAKAAADEQARIDGQRALLAQFSADREAEFNNASRLEQQLGNVSETESKAEQQRLEDRKKMWGQVFETIDQGYQAKIDAGQASLEADEEQQRALAKTNSAARELGLTFSSAFEDAIVNGEKFSDVLVGIEKDIARILVRKSITEPLAKGVSGFDFGSFFSGGESADASAGAEAGSMAAFAEGTDFVPRDGVAMLHKGEAVVPASENTGRGTFAPVTTVTVHAAPGMSEERLAQLVAAKIEEAQARQYRSMRYGGLWSPRRVQN